MGYQESFIYTRKNNVEANRQDIEKIISMFQKYNVRCSDDLLASCDCRLKFNDPVGKFPAGMEMLVVCGERSAQRSSLLLFDAKALTLSERALIRRIRIEPIENRWEILEAEGTDAISVERLSLSPTKGEGQ